VPEIKHGRGNGRPVENGATSPGMPLWEKLGLIKELLRDAGMMCADMDDDDLSSVVWLAQQKVDAAGNLLARRRRLEREEAA
jgi:hypothetical protein